MEREAGTPDKIVEPVCSMSDNSSYQVGTAGGTGMEYVEQLV